MEEEQHPNKSVDNLLRALANRHHYGGNRSSHPSFKSFADNAYPLITSAEGEQSVSDQLVFGLKGTKERKVCRQFFDKYRRRAERGSLNIVPSEYSIWDHVHKTDDLVALLGRNSPLRPTSTRKQRTSTLPVPSPTMSKPHEDPFVKAYQNRIQSALQRVITLGEGYPCDDGIISWTSNDGRKQGDNNYHEHAVVLLPLACREHARIANPRMDGLGNNTGQGKSIVWKDLLYHPVLVSSCIYVFYVFISYVHLQFRYLTLLPSPLY